MAEPDGLTKLWGGAITARVPAALRDVS